jgi:hypothetical protein
MPPQNPDQTAEQSPERKMVDDFRRDLGQLLDRRFGQILERWTAEKRALIAALEAEQRAHLADLELHVADQRAQAESQQAEIARLERRRGLRGKLRWFLFGDG